MYPINGFSHRTAQRHGIGQQCATCGTTERKRSRPAGVALLVAVVAVLGTLLFPASVCAEEGGGGGGHSFGSTGVGIVFYGPVDTALDGGSILEEVGVTANNVYDAAGYVLGYGVGEVKSWTPEQRAKLSNASTGGSFYTYAQSFVHADNPEVYAKACVMYGSDIVYRSYAYTELKRDAQKDLEKVLDGEDVGGGEPVDGDYYVYDFKSKSEYFHDVTKLYVPKDSFTYTAGWGGGFPSSGYLGFSSATATSLSFNSYGLFSDPSATYEMDETNTFYHYIYVTNAYGSSGNISPVTMSVEQDGNKLYVRSVSSKIKVYHDNYGTRTFSTSSNGGKGTAFFNNQTSAPVVPPTNWPDEPQAPEPPELPEPGTNPTVDPTPWSPVLDLPDLSFDLNITTDPASEDILDWVKKIYYELKLFHRDAQQWFTEISDSFEDVVSAINDMSSQIYAQLQRMDSNVSSELQQTRTYLHRLFQWLANQLDFDNDPYNDSNVIYWLKQIWSKLGSGGINTRPTDPTSDPENWWDWLIKAIQNFLIGLAATSSELISDFADVISQVMHQFPFSIPWDIAAFLAAFAAAPVTPEVTITIPAVEGWWASFDYHISMSAFDTAAAAVRAMEKILFAAFLAWKSRDLLDFMDVTKWFNG